VRRLLAAGIAILAAGTVGAIVASRQPEPVTPLVSGVADDTAVGGVLARSCQDCHSDRTRRPWYGHIPPVSWLLDSDIGEARSHMDFSRWSKYSTDDKRQILTSIAANVRNSQMPPGRYLMMHPDARLSAEEIAWICAWTRSERRRLRAEAARAGGDAR